jgi:4'-phosphopantetheinyl transferase
MEMDVPQETLREILQDSSLQFYFHDGWGSEIPGHREKIHECRAQQKDVRDSSISHTKGLGGLVTSRLTMVGLDIEVIERVGDHIVKRVCADPQEFDMAPSAAHLWVAKEAAFKALKGPQQPPLISQVTVSKWKKVAPQIETYWLSDRQNSAYSKGHGAVFLQSPFIISVFTVFP